MESNHTHNFWYLYAFTLILKYSSEISNVYSKIPLSAASLKAVSVLRGSIRLPLNRTLYWNLYMCANERAMHYIATLYTIYLFQRSFVNLPRIKIQTVFSKVTIYVRVKLPRLTLFRLALVLIETVLLYSKIFIESNYTHKFWYLYAFILILISDLYSYSKFGVLIIFILNNTYDVWSFRLLIIQHIQESHNKYESFTNTKILTRRLCVCSVCCAVSFAYMFFFL